MTLTQLLQLGGTMDGGVKHLPQGQVWTYLCLLDLLCSPELYRCSPADSLLPEHHRRQQCELQMDI